MHNKAAVGFFLMIFFTFFPGQAFSGTGLENLLDSRQTNALLAGENPVLVQFNAPRPQLVPRHDTLQNYVETARRTLGPSVMVETLHLYRKPPNAGKSACSAEEELTLYNGILALSTLAGIEYYSASRGGTRILYETSQVVDGPSNKRPLPDPVFSRPQGELTIFARQKDLTFGDNVYQYDFLTAPGALIFSQQNLTSLSVGIIPAVGKNKLRSTVAILDAGEYLVVYLVSMANAASLPGMRDRVGNSFTNRAEAIIKWFSNQADKAFANAH